MFEELIRDIRENLSPDLLKPEYRKRNEENPMFGHCYVASETLYHLLKERVGSDRFKPMWGKDEEGITHWWLVDTQTGKRLDVTADQYYSQGKTPPYENGRGASFLTNEPSKRCKKLLKRIEDS